MSWGMAGGTEVGRGPRIQRQSCAMTVVPRIADETAS